MVICNAPPRIDVMDALSNSGISFRTQVFVVLAGLAILLFVLYLVRHKHLREEYSILWIISALILIFSAIFSDWLETIAYAIGIEYPPAFFLLIAIILILVLQIHFSTVISTFREQNKTLIQDLGILASKLCELKTKQDVSTNRELKGPNAP